MINDIRSKHLSVHRWIRFAVLLVFPKHVSQCNQFPWAPAPGTIFFVAMSGNMTDFRLICQSNCVSLCIFIQALGGRCRLSSSLGLLVLLSRLGNPPSIANMIGTRRRGIAYFPLLRSLGLASRIRNAPLVTKTLHNVLK